MRETIKIKPRKDASISMRRAEVGIVDSIGMSTDSNDNKFFKVKTRSIRIPEIGDKFASRHG